MARSLYTITRHPIGWPWRNRRFIGPGSGRAGARHPTWHPNDDRPYRVHTDRELALMLAGTKPLAAFCDEYPSVHGLYIIPEREFEPHVTAGRLVKREQIELPAATAPAVKGQRMGIRHVLYALPSEHWRIDAYLLLWKTAEKSGWNEGFERMQGSLLGYADWQNDFHIEQHYRKAKRANPNIQPTNEER